LSGAVKISAGLSQAAAFFALRGAGAISTYAIGNIISQVGNLIMDTASPFTSGTQSGFTINFGNAFVSGAANILSAASSFFDVNIYGSVGRVFVSSLANALAEKFTTTICDPYYYDPLKGRICS